MRLLYQILCYANAMSELDKGFTTFGQALDSYIDASTDTMLGGISDKTADVLGCAILEWYESSPVCRHHLVAEINNSCDQYYNGLLITEHTPSWEDAVDAGEWPAVLPVNATWGL